MSQQYFEADPIPQIVMTQKTFRTCTLIYFQRYMNRTLKKKKYFSSNQKSTAGFYRATNPSAQKVSNAADLFPSCGSWGPGGRGSECNQRVKPGLNKRSPKMFQCLRSSVVRIHFHGGVFHFHLVPVNTVGSCNTALVLKVNFLFSRYVNRKRLKAPPLIFSSLRQENQDQLFHRVAGVCRPAGVGAGDALWRHRAGAPALDLRRDLLPGAHLAGRAADHRVHPAPVLHRPGQVRVPTGDGLSKPLAVSIFPLSPISRRNRITFQLWLPSSAHCNCLVLFCWGFFLCFSHEHYCLGDVSSSLLLLPLLSSGGDVNNRLPSSGGFPTHSLTCGCAQGLLRSLLFQCWCLAGRLFRV